jgi:signal transduction histidine kinase
MTHSVLGKTAAATNPEHAKSWKPAPRVLLVSLGVGLAAFLITQIMYRVLVPDIGRYFERMLAEAVSAIVVALLTARLMHIAHERRKDALLRMQVISEMNHHIRNALAAIYLTTDAIQNQQAIRVISESVDRIEWTLREILPRESPMQEEECDRLRYSRRPANKRPAHVPTHLLRSFRNSYHEGKENELS